MALVGGNIGGGDGGSILAKLPTAPLKGGSFQSSALKLPKAAPTPKVPGAPGVPTTGAVTKNPTAQGTADYLTDPGYQAALNAQTQGNADVQSQVNQELSQALIGYGSPGLAGMLSQYGYNLNPEDAAAATANYNAGTATLAQLDQAHSLAKQNIINSLTGHGIADSGDLGYDTGQADQSYANSVYNAQQSLLNQINSFEQNALSQKQSLQSSVDQALQAAWNNVIQNPGAYLTPTDNSTPAATVNAPPKPTPTPKVPTVPNAYNNPNVKANIH